MGYYEQSYFDWQKSMGVFGGKANQFFFAPYIKPNDNVIDFGCGGGYLLANMLCNGKIGLEINDTARAQCAENGVKAFGTVQELPDDWANVIVSFHALEHTFRPLDELKSLYPKLKKGGKIVIVTPFERKWRYKPDDVNQHLYTWSEMNLGNLLNHAGFEVIEAAEIKYKWPPNFVQLHRILGQFGFDIACKLWARWTPFWKPHVNSVRVVATKK